MESYHDAVQAVDEALNMFNLGSLSIEMRALVEIFAEVVSENQIVAPTGSISDAQGNRVWKCTDGVPATVAFSMPATSEWFELEVGDRRIRQSVVPPA